MNVLVTGSSGHLGEALIRVLKGEGHDVIGIDLTASPFTDRIGSITNRALVRECLHNVDTVLHTATLHKPHIVTHKAQDFVDTNISGTLVLLEEGLKAGIESFIFTSTTSAFGAVLTPPPAAPAIWVTEDTKSLPKNIYGVTKTAAEDLCAFIHRSQGLPCLILRTSRFFPEADDDDQLRNAYVNANIKANELLYRRVDLEDVVRAHIHAINKAPSIGFGRYIISASTPFTIHDLADLRRDAPAVVNRIFPEYEKLYKLNNWTMFPQIERVYVNGRAREVLEWRPKYGFQYVLDCIKDGVDFRSELAQVVDSKGYHDRTFEDGPYPV